MIAVDASVAAKWIFTKEYSEQARTLPGFISCAGVGVDSHTTVNVYTWDSEEHCKSGIQQFREWVNRVGIGAQLASIDSTEGEVLVAS